MNNILQRYEKLLCSVSLQKMAIKMFGMSLYIVNSGRFAQ